jgi:thiol-disulfide isomerase/thioredoxin
MYKPCNLLLLISLFTGCNDHQDRTQQLTAAEIELTTLSGEPIDLSVYKGKAIFINFWATWCKPCVQEMPSLQRLSETLGNESIVFLFASEESAEEIETFRLAKNFSMNFLRTGSLTDLNITGLPTTFILNKEGRLIFSEMGAREWDSESSINLVKEIINQ